MDGYCCEYAGHDIGIVWEDEDTVQWVCWRCDAEGFEPR